MKTPQPRDSGDPSQSSSTIGASPLHIRDAEGSEERNEMLAILPAHEVNEVQPDLAHQFDAMTGRLRDVVLIGLTVEEREDRCLDLPATQLEMAFDPPIEPAVDDQEHDDAK
ncbi:MAG TPA: hypothetical protein VNF99_07260 [Stellaceae bacterium]|nr:hypothetical protein [Stellaceae bacterium]